MWFHKLKPSEFAKPGSTTEKLRDKVKKDHAKVEEKLDSSIDHLNALLDETIRIINTKEHSHE